jgi:SAM-dependent methyltransferase
VGVTPLYGGHIFIVLLLCLPLRLDAPLAYFAANISIPPVAPFLTMAELEIGSYLLTRHAFPLSIAELKAAGATLFLRELVVGTSVFSPAMGALGGALAFALVRASRPPSDEGGAFDRVAARYSAKESRAAYHYVRGKLAGDPVAARVVELGSLGEVVDAGCGRGQLGVLLLEMGHATRVVGFDWDEDKVKVAARAADGLAATFHKGDLRDMGGVTDSDTVILADVLHYLTDVEQNDVLRKAARTARRLVVVRELDPDRGWRSRVTRMQERLTTSLGYNRGARVNVRPITALTAVLAAEGFTTDITPCWGATPFANVLVVARRVKRSPPPDSEAEEPESPG